MKNSIRVIVIMFTLLVGGSAWAADIFTPALRLGNAVKVHCQVLNTGTKTALGVTNNIRDLANNSVESVTGDIEPGEVQTTLVNAPTALGHYCRVSGISKKKARVTLCIQDANETPIECVTGQ
ncbi:MAG: hypothetical protein HYV00_07115 [Deltaproteobacteria bacterium]|nr:hypothetical protein [Deltaproteobacteria bacterium]